MNLSLVAVWLVTRTAGVPYAGSDGIGAYELRFGKAEGVGLPDLAATTMEVSLIVLLATLAANLRSSKTTETGQTTSPMQTPRIKERRA